MKSHTPKQIKKYKNHWALTNRTMKRIGSFAHTLKWMTQQLDRIEQEIRRDLKK